MAAASLVDISFTGEIIEWRGPPPFYFIAVPPGHVGEVSFAARHASYGWGCVPAEVTIGDFTFATSLFPKNGGYLVPLKASVRKQLGLLPGDDASLRMRIVAPREVTGDAAW